MPLNTADWVAKVHAAWLGKVAAGSGALPTEMMTKAHIRAKYGVLTGPPQTPTPRGPLDDTTLSLLGWRAALEHGPGFTTQDIAAAWVEHLTDADLQGGGFGREFYEALARLRQGEQPPVVSGTPRTEWIAGQMRAEIWGLLAPGDPALAAEYAARDAAVFNAGNGIYAAQFIAALTSQLMVDPDIATAIEVARQQVPPDSALGKMIAQIVAWHQEEPQDWERVWDLFTETYRDRSMEARLAAWSGEWLVETGGWPEAEVLAEYLGEQGVLRTHPFSDTEPALLTTEVTIPASGGSLALRVTCNDRPANVDWLLRVRIGNQVQERPIRWVDGRQQWQDFTFDLKPWAGGQVTIVLENAVLGKFAWDAGFWCVPELTDGDGRLLHGQPPAGRPYRYPMEFAPKILPETFSVLVGLLYGDGDFRQSVSIATMCGFDTDCNAGTVGCLMGLLVGLDGIPADWKDPLQDRYELQVTGLPREWTITELAQQIVSTGQALALGEAAAPATPAPAVPAPQGTGAQGVGALHPAADPPEGFGAASRGGEGGRVITVTTLADSGPGSLRQALEATGPRIVQFAVEGVIELTNRIRVASGQVTVDGSTAPGEGITVLNHGIWFVGDCDDIIVRDLRIRVLYGAEQGDCLLFWGKDGGTVERVLVDHCSLMWATDEVVNTWGEVRDVTVQWCIIAEAQMPHSKGWLSGVGSDRVSIHHCLFAQNADRNPKVEGGVYDIVNNVIYNWGVNNATKVESGARVNVVNNCYLAGPESAAAEGCVFLDNLDQGTRAFAAGNVSALTPTGAEEQSPLITWYEKAAGGGWVKHQPLPEAYRVAEPFPAEPVTTQSAQAVYELVMARAGARVRDADDLRVVQEVRDRTGHTGRGPG